jgi:predicted nuclease with RNAse H fold
MAHHHIKGSRVSYNQVDTLFCASAFHHSSEGYGWGHKMKKRVMALLVHNETRWVGLSAEAVPRTSTKWPSDTLIVTEVDIEGMPVPLTQNCRFRALEGLAARQKIPLHLPEFKELSNDEK